MSGRVLRRAGPQRECAPRAAAICSGTRLPRQCCAVVPRWTPLPLCCDIARRLPWRIMPRWMLPCLARWHRLDGGQNGECSTSGIPRCGPRRIATWGDAIRSRWPVAIYALATVEDGLLMSPALFTVMRIGCETGIRGLPGEKGSRRHALRHTFAVCSLEACGDDRRAVICASD